MTDVATVNSDVVNPQESITDQRPDINNPGIKIVSRIFAAANKREGALQFILFVLGLGLAIPLLGFDVLLMLISGLVGLNATSRKLAWIIEKTGVLFPAMGLALAVSVLTFTVAPVKTIRTEIVKTIRASPAAASTTDDGGAVPN